MIIKTERKYRPREWAQLIFLGLIICIGVYLIIFSLFMIRADTSGSSDAFMLAVAMIGVACTMIWFAISNFEIKSTEEKLGSLTERLDDIINKIEKK
jgi:ABC-type nickel/cobalt efflux system permease component RcnA